MAVTVEVPAPRTTPSTPGAAAALPRAAASVLLALGVALAYVIAGVWAAGRHVYAPDALEALGRATLAWHGDPSKLAYLGFDAPPLPRLALIPAALFAHAPAALAVTGALLAGTMVALLDRTLARCGLAGAGRAALVAAVALDPLLIFHAGAGTPVTLELALLALALHGFVGWAIDASPAGLLEAGVAFAGLALTRYGLAAWWLVAALTVAAALAARLAPRDEIEGSTLAFAAPLAAGVAAWVLLAAITDNSAGGWVAGAWVAGPAGAHDVAGHALELVVQAAPLAVAVVAALLVRRDAAGLGLAALIVAGAIAMPVHALLADRDGPLALAHALPLLLVAVVGVGWLWRTWREPLVLAVAPALVVAGDVASWRAMTHYAIRDGESAWVHAVRTGDDQDGAATERRLAAQLPARGRVAADDETAALLADFGVRPRALVTPAGLGARRWRSELRRADYVIARPGDAVDHAIPGLIDSTAPGYVVVRSLPPYVLARVT